MYRTMSFVILGLLAWGCADSPTTASRSKVSAEVGSHHQLSLARNSNAPFDAAMARVADRVPGFGGMYYDRDGKPVAYLMDVTKASVLKDAIIAELGAMPGFADSPMQVRTGAFDVRDLVLWRQELEPNLNWRSISFTQIAPSINRVNVGVQTPGDSDVVRAAANTLGIPSGALRITVAPSAIHLATTINDRVRPVMGGLEIGNAPAVGYPSYSCTLGIPVEKSGSSQIYFMTNSHCSPTVGGVDAGFYMYQLLTPSSDSIGIESDDPAWTSMTGCPAGYGCRYSDAALYRSLVPSTDAAFATIARTGGYPPSGTSWGTNGSFTLTPDTNFTITGELPDSWLVPGQLYQKIGKTTGWTSGYIWSAANGDPYDGSCVTIQHGSISGQYMLCQYVGSAYLQDGDSGSPVFIRATTSTVNFLGIAWGWLTVGTTNGSIFSTIGGVRNDLGSLVTH